MKVINIKYLSLLWSYLKAAFCEDLKNIKTILTFLLPYIFQHLVSLKPALNSGCSKTEIKFKINSLYYKLWSEYMHYTFTSFQCIFFSSFFYMLFLVDIIWTFLLCSFKSLFPKEMYWQLEHFFLVWKLSTCSVCSFFESKHFAQLLHSMFREILFTDW